MSAPIRQLNSVVVLGGTGFVGHHLCEQLVRQGWRVTVPTRRRANAQAIQILPGLSVVQADVHDPQALQAVIAGHDAVVNLVAILHGRAEDFERVHVRLPQSIARACQAAGVRRVVHVSALGASAQGPSMYLRSKAAGEAVLTSHDLDVTILRPSVIFGEDDAFLNLFARLQRLAPVMPLAGAAARFQPVWVLDVARAIVAALEQPQTAGRVYEACGPEVYSLRELVQFAGRHGSRQRTVIALPAGLARLQARLMELAPGQPMMSRDNLDSMKVDNVATPGQPGLNALGIAAASMAGIAPAWLARQDAQCQLNAHRRGAGRN